MRGTCELIRKVKKNLNSLRLTLNELCPKNDTAPPPLPMLGGIKGFMFKYCFFIVNLYSKYHIFQQCTVFTFKRFKIKILINFYIYTLNPRWNFLQRTLYLKFMYSYLGRFTPQTQLVYYFLGFSKGIFPRATPQVTIPQVELPKCASFQVATSKRLGLV